MADRETRRLSFGSVATDYDRYRPSPPPQALDWLIPPGAQAVLDLAAGTGVVTRELVGRAPRVIAVEPDERMRAVLADFSRRVGAFLDRQPWDRTDLPLICRCLRSRATPRLAAFSGALVPQAQMPALGLPVGRGQGTRTGYPAAATATISSASSASTKPSATARDVAARNAAAYSAWPPG